MANVDAQIGLRPLNAPNGNAPRIRPYTRSTTGAIYEGQLLYQASTGFVAYTGTATGDGDILGAAAHYAAADDTEIHVYDDPDQEYLIQADGNAVSTTTQLLATIGRYCNLVSDTSGSTTTLQSKAELDTSEVTATAVAGDVLQIVRFWEGVGNELSSANEKWVVKVRPGSHRFTSGATLT